MASTLTRNGCGDDNNKDWRKEYLNKIFAIPNKKNNLDEQSNPNNQSL